MAKKTTSAALSLVSVKGNKIIVSTKGTEVAPGAKWKGWLIKWGDEEEIGGNADPDEILEHEYPILIPEPGLTEDVYDISFEVKDNKGKSSFAVIDNVIITRNPIGPLPTPNPNITLMTPISGPVGVEVKLNGTNFGAPGVNQVTFAGISAAINTWADTEITAVVPASINGLVPVIVIRNPPNPPGTSAPVTFNVQSPPITDHLGYRPQMYQSIGMDSKGGRGLWNGTSGTPPRLIIVDSLSDTRAALSAPVTINGMQVHRGQFGSACLAQFPAFIVFEISGYITLNSILNMINESGAYKTIAGQTAPAPGICIRSAASNIPTDTAAKYINLSTHDIVLQHIRVRMGDSSCNSGILGFSSGTAAPRHHNILDHVSVSWCQDDGVNFSQGTTNLTMWRCLISEMLHHTPNCDLCEGGGTSGGHGLGVGQTGPWAVLESIFAHNVERNVFGGGNICAQNNLFYQTRDGPSIGNFSGTDPAAHWRVDSNYFRRSSVAGSGMTAIVLNTCPAGSQVYLNDNVLDNGPNLPNISPLFLSGVDPRVGSPTGLPTISGYTPLPGSAVMAHCMLVSGARPKFRTGVDNDGVDSRIVSEITARTGGYKSVIPGGYPVLANNSNTFTVPPNPLGIADAVGRTNLEVYLEQLAQAVEP